MPGVGAPKSDGPNRPPIAYHARDGLSSSSYEPRTPPPRRFAHADRGCRAGALASLRLWRRLPTALLHQVRTTLSYLADDDPARSGIDDARALSAAILFRIETLQMRQRLSPPHAAKLGSNALDWALELLSVLFKISGLMLSSLGPAWLVAQYQLSALTHASDERAHRAGLSTATDVSNAGNMFLQVLCELAPWTATGYLVVIVLARFLAHRHVGTPTIRVASAALCASVAAATLVLSVIGFYQPITLGGLAAGSLGGLLFGAIVVPSSLRFTPN